MQRQAFSRIAPIARAAVGVQRRNFVDGLTNKQNLVREKQAFFQRQGTAVNGEAPTWLRREGSDKAVAGTWAALTLFGTLTCVKMFYDMTWNNNKREDM